MEVFFEFRRRKETVGLLYLIFKFPHRLFWIFDRFFHVLRTIERLKRAENSKAEWKT